MAVPSDKMRSMKAVGYPKAVDALSLAITPGWPVPVPLADQVLIEVHAFGLNFADTMARKGFYPDAPPFPCIVGYEVAGIISEVGPQAVADGFQLKPGDKVFAFTHFGGYAEYAVAFHWGVWALPEGMSWAEGASIPVNCVTAYHALFFTGPLFPGDRVLVHAAAGGVGQMAVQLAKNAGCEVFGTASSPEKLSLLTSSYHLDHPINYVKDNFSKKVREITGVPKGGCLDVVLDSIGGGQIKEDLELIGAAGRVIAFGVSSLTDRSFTGILSSIPKALSMMSINSIDLLTHSKTLVGLNLLPVALQKPKLVSQAINQCLSLFLQRKLHTVVSREYDWSQIGQAHKDLEERRTTGKIVLLIKRDEQGNVIVHPNNYNNNNNINNASSSLSEPSVASSSQPSPSVPSSSTPPAQQQAAATYTSESSLSKSVDHSPSNN